MRLLFAVLGLCLGGDADNALQGQWRIVVGSQPNYVGTVLVDAERRVTWDSPADYGKPAKFQGYVAVSDGEIVEFVLTNRSSVVRALCKLESSNLLHCYLAFKDRPQSPPFDLVRVGPGPAKLRSVLP